MQIVHRDHFGELGHGLHEGLLVYVLGDALEEDAEVIPQREEHII